MSRASYIDQISVSRVTSRWNKMDKSGVFARRPIYEQFRWNNYFNCASISADNNLVTGMMEKAICNGRFSPSISRYCFDATKLRVVENFLFDFLIVVRLFVFKRMFEISDIFKIVYYYIYIFVQKVMLVLGERISLRNICSILLLIICKRIMIYYLNLMK